MAELEITADQVPTSYKMDPVLKQKVDRNLLRFGLVAVIMAFAALTSAYLVSKSDNFWVHVPMPSQFLTSSIIIVLGSLAVHFALLAARKNNTRGVNIGLLLTLVSGIAFTVLQFQGWSALLDTGNAVTGNIEQVKGKYGVDYSISFNDKLLVLNNGNYYAPDDEGYKRPLNTRLMSTGNTASSFIYLMSGLHLAHLGLGLILLLIVLAKAMKGKYHAEYTNGVKLIATYWHFLGGLWIYLFLFLTIIH